MSDKLSTLMQNVVEQMPRPEEDPEERLITALEKALQATTPERAGCPWDNTLEEDRERAEESGL